MLLFCHYTRSHYYDHHLIWYHRYQEPLWFQRNSQHVWWIIHRVNTTIELNYRPTKAQSVLSQGNRMVWVAIRGLYNAPPSNTVLPDVLHPAPGKTLWMYIILKGWIPTQISSQYVWHLICPYVLSVILTISGEVKPFTYIRCKFSVYMKMLPCFLWC